jgi:hypothetical protein
MPGSGLGKRRASSWGSAIVQWSRVRIHLHRWRGRLHVTLNLQNVSDSDEVKRQVMELLAALRISGVDAEAPT